MYERERERQRQRAQEMSSIYTFTDKYIMYVSAINTMASTNNIALAIPNGKMKVN